MGDESPINPGTYRSGNIPPHSTTYTNGTSPPPSSREGAMADWLVGWSLANKDIVTRQYMEILSRNIKATQYLSLHHLVAEG